MRGVRVRSFLPAVVGLLGALTIAAPAGATASTHVWAPSTDVQRFGILHVTSDLYVPVAGTKSGQRNPSVTNLGVTCGVLPLSKLNFELGVDHKTGLGVLDAYPLYGNAKIGIPEGAFSRYLPALAAGIFDAGTKEGATDYNVVYAKAAKTFGPVGRVSAGYFSGNDKLLVRANGKKDREGAMFAWERAMPEVSDKFWLCVDYMGTQSAYGTLSFGGSWRFAPNMTLLAGYDIFNDSDLSPNTVTIQADVDFDLTR